MLKFQFMRWAAALSLSAMTHSSIPAPLAAEADTTAATLNDVKAEKIEPAPLLEGPLIVAMDTHTGMCWMNARDPNVLTHRFPQASLQKLVVIKAALDLIRDGKLSPNLEVRWTDFSRSVEGSTLRTAIFKYNKERLERLEQQAARTLPADASDADIRDFVNARYSEIPVPRVMSVLELLESAKKGSHNDSTRLLAQVVARELGYKDNAEGIEHMLTRLIADYGLSATSASDPAGMTDEDLPRGTNEQTVLERDLRVGMFSNARDMMWLSYLTLDVADDAPIVRTNALERIFKNTHLQIHDFAGSDHFAGFLSSRGLFLIKTGTQEDNYHMIAASRDGRHIYATFGAHDNNERRAGIETALRNRSALEHAAPPTSGVISQCIINPNTFRFFQNNLTTASVFLPHHPVVTPRLRPEGLF